MATRTHKLALIVGTTVAVLCPSCAHEQPDPEQGSDIWTPEQLRAENGKPHPETGSKVVLTIMHLDHDLANVEPSNFAAGCQRCHLTYDAQLHAKNAAVTRRAKSPQLDLMDLIAT